MITRQTRFLIATVFTLLTMFGIAQSQMAPSPVIREIQLSFKRDLREVDPFRGIGLWSTAPSYTGAAAQDTVEIKAAGKTPSGKLAKISPQWTSSDPEMVTITPSQGDDVNVSVHKEGECRLTIAYQGLTKELVVGATKAGSLFVFKIAPPALPSMSGPVVRQIDPALKDQKAQISYAAGMRLAKTLHAQAQDVDPDLVAKAIRDVMAGGATMMSDDQVQTALMGVETQLNVTAATLEKKKFVEKNKKDADAFLADNKKKEGVVTLPSGLQYKIMKEGDGKKPTSLDVAVCQYKARLIDGTEFDNSYRRKDGGPVNFPVKAVIKGWQEALRMMPAGSKWQIVVPPDLAYGERGVPRAKIPPNAALIFDVELLAVKEPGDPSPSKTTQKTALTPQQIDAVKSAAQSGDKESEKWEKNQ